MWGLNAAGQIFTFNPFTQSWNQVPGSLMQIAVGSANAVWGVSAQQQVYHFNPQTQGWDQILGVALTQITVGANGAVWGLDSTQQIFTFDPQTQGWDQIPGTLSQIAVGNDGSVWGVNAAQQIFTLNVPPSLTRTWQALPGQLAQVAVSGDGSVWGINAAHNIYAFNAQTQSWQQVPGSLTQIAVGSANAVWGINAQQQIYQYNPQTQGWNQVPGLLIQVGVAFDGTVWGINSAQNIFAYNPQTQGWSQMAGQLSQIAVGSDGIVWGINSAQQIYRLQSLTVSTSVCPNNTLLNGNYAFMINGWHDATDASSAIGSIVADGNGNITSGSFDDADQTHKAPEIGGTIIGTYCVDSNNLATINITLGGGPGGFSTPTLKASLDSVSNGVSSNGHIIEYDTSGHLFSGLLRKQDTSAFSTGKITGNYAFGYVGAGLSANRIALAGQFNSNGSGNLSGVYDADDAGMLQTNQSFTSNDLSVASTGHGTLTVTTSSGNLNYVFYVVSASELLVMAADTSTPPTILAGRVLKQSGPFTNASLNGVSVYETEGLDIKNTPATPEATAGLVTTNGAGSFTFSADVNDGGTLGTGTDSGTYSVASNGRVTVTSNSPLGNEPVLYLIGQNQAFVIGTNGAVDFGVMQPQTGSNFTNASLSGNFLGGSEPAVSFNGSTEVDYLQIDGAGNFNITTDNNSSGGPSTNNNSGTYAVSSNGRVVVSQGGVQVVLLYIISASQAVVLPTQDSDPKMLDFHK